MMTSSTLPSRLLLFVAVVAAGCATDTRSPDPIVRLSSGGEIGRKLNPVWLAGGEIILFGGLRNGNWDLFALDSAGQARPWGRDVVWEGTPAAWPGQDRVVFERFDRRAGASTMWSAGLDGSDERRLSARTGFRPEPSPDGRRIAFDDGVEVEPGRTTHQLFVMDADGNRPRRLTATLSYDAAPSWSPDGARLAFDSQRDDQDRDFNRARSEIYVTNADGTDQRRLTFLNARSRYSAWSPRGDLIAFESNAPGNVELYVVPANGGEPIRLTDSPGAERTPSWSLDGRRILYSYETDGRAELRELRLPARQRR